MITNDDGPSDRYATELAGAEASTRLRAALAAGTAADPATVPALIARCAVEPDFYVRDMLTWALCRMPAETTVPALVDETRSGRPQARSQALHTLSKIGALPENSGSAVRSAVAASIHDVDDEVARSAWRAAVALVPPGSEESLAENLAGALGRGGPDVQRSLSRALVALGDVVLPILDTASRHRDERVRAHADATEALYRDPESAFTLSVESAKRTAALGTEST